MNDSNSQLSADRGIKDNSAKSTKENDSLSDKEKANVVIYENSNEKITYQVIS